MFVNSIPLTLKFWAEFLKKSFSSQLKNPIVFSFTFLDKVKIAFNDASSLLLKLVLDALKFGVKEFKLINVFTLWLSPILAGSP